MAQKTFGAKKYTQTIAQPWPNAPTRASPQTCDHGIVSSVVVSLTHFGANFLPHRRRLVDRDNAPRPQFKSSPLEQWGIAPWKTPPGLSEFLPTAENIFGGTKLARNGPPPKSDQFLGAQRMVLNGEHSQAEIIKSGSGSVGLGRNGGSGSVAVSSISNPDGFDRSKGTRMDHIQGKLAGMQLGPGGVDAGKGGGGQQHVVTSHSLGPAGGGGGAPGGIADPAKGGPYHTAHTAAGPAGDMTGAPGGALSKAHGGNNDFFTFAPGAMGLGGVDGSGAIAVAATAAASAGAPQHPTGIGYLATPPNGGAGTQMYNKKVGVQDSTSAGRSGAEVSRRYGVPMGTGGSRNSTNNAGNRSGGAGPAVADGGGVGYGGDGGRRGGGGGRRGQGVAGGMNGGIGIGVGGRARVPVMRGYGEGSSPLRGDMEPSPLQVGIRAAITRRSLVRTAQKYTVFIAFTVQP